MRRSPAFVRRDESGPQLAGGTVRLRPPVPHHRRQALGKAPALGHASQPGSYPARRSGPDPVRGRRTPRTSMPGLPLALASCPARSRIRLGSRRVCPVRTLQSHGSIVDRPRRRFSARIDIGLLPDRTLHPVISKAKGSDTFAAQCGAAPCLGKCRGFLEGISPRRRYRRQMQGFLAGTWQPPFLISPLW